MVLKTLRFGKNQTSPFRLRKQSGVSPGRFSRRNARRADGLPASLARAIAASSRSGGSATPSFESSRRISSAVFRARTIPATSASARRPPSASGSALASREASRLSRAASASPASSSEDARAISSSASLRSNSRKPRDFRYSRQLSASAISVSYRYGFSADTARSPSDLEYDSTSIRAPEAASPEFSGFSPEFPAERLAVSEFVATLMSDERDAVASTRAGLAPGRAAFSVREEDLATFPSLMSRSFHFCKVFSVSGRYVVLTYSTLFLFP